jgi:hypothetical protein
MSLIRGLDRGRWMDMTVPLHWNERLCRVGLGNPRLWIAAGLLSISILSGQFTLARLLPGLPENLTRIRLLATLIAVIVLWPEIRRNARQCLSAPVLALLAFCAYMLVRGLFDFGATGATKALDILFLVVQAGLIAVAGSLADVRRATAVSIILIALTLLLMECKGQLGFLTGQPNQFGFGWNSLVGAISFNRVQFAGFCLVLALLTLSSDRPAKVRIVGMALATLMLFGVWGTLQKAALVASILVIAAMAAACLVRHEWRFFWGLAIIASSAAVLTTLVFGSHVSGRLQHSFKLSGGPSALQDERLQVADAGAAKAAQKSELVQSDADLVTLPVTNEAGQAILKIRYCYFKSATLVERKPGTPVLCYERSITDSTGRVSLAVEAIRGFVAKPIFGNGLGTFRVLFIHPEVGTPDLYLYPHDLPLEIAFEGGAVGLGLLLVALIVGAWFAFQSAAPIGIQIPLLGFAGFMAVSVLFSGDVYDSRLLWHTLVALGLWKLTPPVRV